MTINQSKKQRREKKRLIRLGLRVWCVHIPDILYKQFKRQVRKDGVSIRAVSVAMIELYVRGEFKIDKENKAES